MSGSVGNGGVDLSGTQNGSGPGSGSGNAGSGNTGAGSGNSGNGAGGGPGSGTIPKPPPPPRDGYTVTMPGEELPTAVTLADIRSFVPHAAVARMEPNGWMVIGLHTNFYAVGSQHIVDGELLGRPASVRFTPSAYHWAYGDGSTANLSTKGSTWAAQRIAEFDPTPTSHIFRAAGTYTITLTVDVGAEYRFDGGGWIPIAGTLPVAANQLVATAGRADTVLVGRDCLAHPSGPGC
ncbi:PKD domain-containing protein [Lacisediminihabitans changchengi]|uniref:PKD domain-containing protein n=1 Tax=Lacisediminihabitans changchengi TaxID=2787634 RepID=A0A934SIN7_9MICO|nr:PKD domain-containing protein [Lacisediminihabitans changchengi]MBK4347377.1 PKD domain-containing protein [Lacisediminihabitans changchengi]